MPSGIGNKIKEDGAKMSAKEKKYVNLQVTKEFMEKLKKKKDETGISFIRLVEQAWELSERQKEESK